MKAEAVCVCESCGAKFSVFKTVWSGRDRDSFREWAWDNCKTCRKCEAIEWSKNEAKKGLYIVLAYNFNCFLQKTDKFIHFIIRGDTYVNKEAIKALGGERKIVSGSRTDWVISCSLDEACDMAEKLRKLGCRLEEVPDMDKRAIRRRVRDAIYDAIEYFVNYCK